MYNRFMKINALIFDFWIWWNQKTGDRSRSGNSVNGALNTLATKQWIDKKAETKKRLTRWRARLKLMWFHCNHSKQTIEVEQEENVKTQKNTSIEWIKSVIILSHSDFPFRNRSLKYTPYVLRVSQWEQQLLLYLVTSASSTKHWTLNTKHNVNYETKCFYRIVEWMYSYVWSALASMQLNNIATYNIMLPMCIMYNVSCIWIKQLQQQRKQFIAE